MFKEAFISGDKFFAIPETDRFRHFCNHDAWNAFAFMLEAKKNPDKPYTILTHNSDWSTSMLLGEVGLDLVDFPKNIYWFAQNVDVKHERIKSIPIGLENEKWHPGKNDLIEFYSSRMKVFDILCCAMFNPNTHPSRKNALEHFQKENWCVTQETLNGHGMEFYFEVLNKSLYCVCPRGNGIDTHRFWEAVYMGCIPIVEDCINVNFYKKLPILICDKFEDITGDYLNQVMSTRLVYEILCCDFKLSDFRYWKRKILRKVNRETP